MCHRVEPESHPRSIHKRRRASFNAPSRDLYFSHSHRRTQSEPEMRCQPYKRIMLIVFQQVVRDCCIPDRSGVGRQSAIGTVVGSELCHFRLVHKPVAIWNHHASEMATNRSCAPSCSERERLSKARVRNGQMPVSTPLRDVEAQIPPAHVPAVRGQRERLWSRSGRNAIRAMEALPGKVASEI